jgi:hypothetical protein
LCSSIFDNNLNLSWGATIIIITNKDDEVLFKYLLKLRKHGFNIKIIIVGDEVVHKQYLNKNLTAPLTIYQIRGEDEIYEL